MPKTPERQLLLQLVSEPKVILCACNCGLPTTWNNRRKRFNIYIQGHHMKTPESRDIKAKQRSKQSLEMWQNPEYRKQKTEQSRKQMSAMWQKPEFREKMTNRIIEVCRTPEHREKMAAFSQTPEYRKQASDRFLKKWQNPEFREKMSAKFDTTDFRDKVSKQSIKNWQNPEFRENISKKVSKQMTAQWQDPEFRQRMYIQNNSPEYREKQSKIHIDLWQTQEYRDKSLKATLISPNKPETILNQLTPSEVRYTGNRSFWVRIKLLVDGEYITKNKNPDFKISGQRKVIEMYGDFWHKNDNPDDLIKAYKEIGYDCLVIWESEIYNELEATVERIAQFIDKPQWQLTLL